MKRYSGTLIVAVLTIIGSFPLTSERSVALIQESDLSGSSGVFIEPPKVRKRRPRRERTTASSTASSSRATSRPTETSATRPDPADTPSSTTAGPEPKSTTTATTTPVERVDPAESFNTKGEAAARAGQHLEAVAAFREAVRAKPGFSAALYNLGLSYTQLGQLPEAIQVFTQLTKLTPADPEAHSSLGDTLRESKRHADAARAYQEAARLEPEDLEVQYYLGYSLAREKQWAQAATALEKVVRGRPDNTDALINLSWVYNNSNRLRDSIGILKPAVTANPALGAGHFNLGIAYSRLAQLRETKDSDRKNLYSQAVDAFKHALKQRSDWAEAHNNLGFALGNLGRFTEAIPEHTEALRLKPIFPAALFNLSYAYRKSGDKKRALQTYEQLKAIDPQLAKLLHPLIK